MIKAPFNFVPLNDKPYIPKWAEMISQDIPFKDGLSGSLKIKISAESPIFVSDRIIEDNTVACEFCHVIDEQGNKRFFIPGTTIKGMIRAVAEILSFGKMTQVQNQSFGIRDLSNGADGLFYRAKVKVNNVHCGWLRHENNQYLINDCGLPWRISAEELDRKFNIGLMEFIQNGENFKSDANKTAKKKYQMFYAQANDNDLTDYFIPDTQIGISAGGRKFVCFSGSGECGTVVFTGQPGVRQQKYNDKKKKKIWSGKFFEFVFPEQTIKKDVVVPDNVFKAFDSIHQNSADYVDFRKKQLRSGEEIPVFFIYDEEENIDTIGISYMYKFPAFNSVYNGIPVDLLDNNSRDLCECIFGYADLNDSLRGRVQFVSAMLQNEASFYAEKTLALAKPHPSYYPIYLGKGQTWNTEHIRIAGRKRYPVRGADHILNNMGTDKMSRIIRPLNKGSIFEGSIHFHNLLPIELGALISAIDFCQNDDCFHNIGQGKPLGYGKVKVSLIDTDIKDLDGKSYSSDMARASFITEMGNSFAGWSKSNQLTELFAMARGIPFDKYDHFEYMTMSVDTEENEFKKGYEGYAKGAQLGTFTQILSNNVPHIAQQSNVSIDAKRIDIEQQLAKQQEKRVKLQQKFDAALSAFNNKDYVSATKLFEDVSKESSSFDLEIKGYLKSIENIKAEADEIAEKAKAAFADKNFKEAKQLYKDAADYGFESYQAKIDECQMEIDKIQTLTSNIASFLEGIKLASIAAFANKLNKRNDVTTITEEDVPFIIAKLSSEIKVLSKKDQKNWLDRKKWKPIEDALKSKTLADRIFEGIKVE